VPDDIKDLILSTIEAALTAQLHAIRQLRRAGPKPPPQAARAKGRSQVDMAYDILLNARTPLHVNEILTRIQATFGTAVDRESLVSSLTKKVRRGDRFRRTAKNTFGLKEVA
jgi:hypothetical protein